MKEKAETARRPRTRLWESRGRPASSASGDRGKTPCGRRAWAKSCSLTIWYSTTSPIVEARGRGPSFQKRGGHYGFEYGHPWRSAASTGDLGVLTAARLAVVLTSLPAVRPSFRDAGFSAAAPSWARPYFVQVIKFCRGCRRERTLRGDLVWRGLHVACALGS